MITRKHLKELGFSIHERLFFWNETNGIDRREAIMNLENNRGLYIRGETLFFIDGMCTLYLKSREWLWQQRHINLKNMPLSYFNSIVSEAKDGCWLMNNPKKT